MKTLIYIVTCVSLISCTNDWLNAKPDSSLVIPQSVDDYQKLLDNSLIMNISHIGGLSELAAGDFKVDDASFISSTTMTRNCYSWSSDDNFFEGSRDPDWRSSWQRILNTNLAIENLDQLSQFAHSNDWKNAKGSALFYRANEFFSLSQQYCKPYSMNAENDLGLPLRVSSDINKVEKRANLKATYDLIFSDLNNSLDLLPKEQVYKTRPSKAAVEALLARIYLSMRDYENALIHATAALNQYNRLLNYSDMDANANYPFIQMNDEVIYYDRLTSYNLFATSRLNVVDDLLNAYDNDDLRRQLFFRTINTNTYFKGSYDGSSFFFCGLSVDELFLISAECNARAGNMEGSLKILNDLLQHRWSKDVVYKAYSTDDQGDLINRILLERRKELCFRGLRWSDLRRLNQEEGHKVTLTREIVGEHRELPPNDPRYQFPLDQNEIDYGGLEQNIRK